MEGSSFEDGIFGSGLVGSASDRYDNKLENNLEEHKSSSQLYVDFILT